MRAYLTLTRRELAAYFVTWIGYVVIALAALLMGLSFVILLHKLRLQPSPVPVTQLFFGTQFFWIILLLTPPLITMRLFAHERASGTFETLLTSPVRDSQVVLAKFTAAMIFYLLMWLPLTGCLVLGWRFSGASGPPDPGTLVGTGLAVLLPGALCLSLGCLGSALARSQSIAAMLGAAGCVGLFLVGFLGDRFNAGRDLGSQLLYSAALKDHLEDLVRGVVDTRPVVFCLTFTAFLLFVTLRVLESRRWRK
jgi:ABC-2 type transport system permease protein